MRASVSPPGPWLAADGSVAQERREVEEIARRENAQISKEERTLEDAQRAERERTRAGWNAGMSPLPAAIDRRDRFRRL